MSEGLKLNRLAVIDLGSNSVRLFIYEESLDNTYTQLLTEKFMVKLGEEVFETKKLNKNAIKRTLDALKIFKYLIDKNEVNQIKAFGTCALRTAKNSQDFIDLVKEETQIDIEIISGQREAQLIAEGILTDPSLPKEEEMYFIDIGGGSTEVSLYSNGKIKKAYSFDLGANRLSQKYMTKFYELSDSKDKKKILKELKSFCQEELIKVLEKENWPKISTAIGSSGTIKAYQRILRKHNLAYSPFKTNDLEECISSLSKLNSQELLSVPGMQEKRLDQILAGGILLQEILNELGCSDVFTSKLALRDGVIFEMKRPSKAGQNPLQ